jgi:hypothetical protein
MSTAFHGVSRSVPAPHRRRQQHHHHGPSALPLSSQPTRSNSRRLHRGRRRRTTTTTHGVFSIICELAWDDRIGRCVVRTASLLPSRFQPAHSLACGTPGKSLEQFTGCSWPFHRSTGTIWYDLPVGCVGWTLVAGVAPCATAQNLNTPHETAGHNKDEIEHDLLCIF